MIRYYIAHGATTVDSPAGPLVLGPGDSLRWDDPLSLGPPRIVDGGPLSEPMTEEEYVAWMRTQRLVEYAEFVEAVREQAFRSDDPGTAARFPSGIVHCFTGLIGADWSAESVIDVLSRAFLVEWDTRHLLGHQLHVKWNEAPFGEPARHREAHFDVKAPVVEDLDGAPLPPSCQPNGSVYLAVRAWMLGNADDEDGVDETELRNLLIALAPHLEADDAVDWEGVCQRAMAVCAGAGAPGDATLPEACEWLAYQIHGPTLQPGVPSPLERALEAIRLTQEYAQLPAVEGWTWYDVYRSLRPDDAERLRRDWLRHKENIDQRVLQPDGPLSERDLVEAAFAQTQAALAVAEDTVAQLQRTLDNRRGDRRRRFGRRRRGE